MVQFGRKLDAEKNPEWAAYYVEYNGCKVLIREMRALFEENRDIVAVHGKCQVFSTKLDYNIDRAVTFYEEQLREVVNGILSVRNKWPFICPATLPEIYDQLKDCAVLLKDALRFVEINAEAVRKILKKAEKVLSISVVSRDEFMRERLRPDCRDSRLAELRVNAGVDKLIEELRLRLDRLRTIEASWLEQSVVDEIFVKRVHARKNTLPILTELCDTATRTLHVTKWYFGLLNQAQVDYEQDPVGDASNWGIFLNNYSTFLYLANYYSVIPTASMYAEALNMSPSISGILLAMAPLAALLSSIWYSLWSNRSFFQPLLFCSLLLISGNLMYALALDYNMAWMMFVGRLLVGLGGNRAVNRRYLADFVPQETRTFHSAIFVGVGSLGMSLGPGLQALFDAADFKIAGRYTVNYLTAPGWLMAVMWTVFFLQIVFCFKDPERRYGSTNKPSLLAPLLSATSTPPFQAEEVRSSSYAHLIPVGHSSSTNRNHFIDIDGTVVCLWAYFVLKLVQEAFQTASPLVTKELFKWPDYYVGYLLAAVGFIVLPANVLVGLLSEYVDDQVSQAVSMVLLGVGTLISLDYSHGITQWRYCISALMVFSSAQILEGVNMGLLSKVMPKTMSRGLWNSGFLSTEAGTFGRVVGNVMISLAGSLAGFGLLQNLTMIPCVILVTVSLVFVIWKRRSLIPMGARLVDYNEADEMLRSEILARVPELRPLDTWNRRKSVMSFVGSGSLCSQRSSLRVQDGSARVFRSLESVTLRH